MSKLTSIATYSVFNRLWEDNQINDSSLIFILDTGQLYTHGMFINGAIFGSATTQAVPITIAGSTYTLSLSSHTHSNYLEKNTDIDITGNKITSDNIDVLYYSGGGLYFGDSSTPIYVSGSLNTFRNNTVYDVLDTGNFSVSTTLPTGHVLSNTAYIQYGSSSFQIDYVKRVNTSQSFDYLNSYTQAGTTLLNGKYYGYITLYTDTVFTNPAWAQMRIDISGRTLEYRTSANPNSWINLNTPEVLMNALNVAGLVAAPTSTTINKVWKTDGDGNPGWRDESSYTFSNLKFQLISGTDLMTYNTLAAKTILAGSNISFTHENGTLTIKAQDTTYGVVSKTSAGLAPQLPNEDTVTKFLRQDGTWATPTYTSDTNTWREIKVNGTQKRSTSITSGDLNFINGSNTTVEWTSDNKLKINSTWTAWKGATDSANGTAGYMPAPTSAQRGQFLRGDGSWVSLNNYSLPTASNDTLGGVKTGAAITDTTGYTAVAIKDGVIYYKDTNTTYSFSNLLFQQTSGTNLMTYNSQAVRTILAGSNITFTHSNNVLTIAAKDTTYSTVSKTAAGLCPILPNETTTTKYLRLDGTWLTPPDNNTWKAANASQEGYVPKSTANKILRANADGALYWGDDANTTYTFYNLLFQNSGGTTVDTYKPTTSPTKTLKAGSNVTISAASNVITISSTDTNTWRGILDNLTSSSNTTESLSAKQGYLLANGSARDNTKLPLSGGWMDDSAQVLWKGINGSTSVYTRMGYYSTGSSSMPTYAKDAHNDTKAFYIMSNGYNAGNDWGGLSIDDEGVSVFGAGDAGSNFTGVFRVFNEDSFDDGPQFIVTKASGATTKYSHTAQRFISNVATGTQPYACTSTTVNTNLNADLLDGNHANAFATSGHNHDSTYAKLAAHNNLTASGNEFTFASNAFSGGIWINYRTAGGSNGNITQYYFGNGAGGSLASITSGTFNGNCTGSAGSVAWSNVSSKPGATGGSTTPVYWNGSGFTNCTSYGSASVNYANYSGYLPPKYDGGQKTNPQSYFNYDIGVRVAMTGAWSVWSDTLWINGYSGGDVRNMCALHFLRNGTPRMAISTQRADATSYGTYYEVITAYNIASQSVNYASSAGSVAWSNVSGRPSSMPASDVYSWAKASSKPSYNFGEIGAGVATIGDGANRLMFRTNSSYASGIYYSTPGNEALVFANTYNVTSWIFANTNPTSLTAWTSLTPALLIKQNCVYINSLIPNGTSPSSKLLVNGGEVRVINGYVVSKRTDSGMDGNGFTIEGISRSMSFAIGSGNVNRGVYDHTAGKWILYWDASSTYLDFGNVYAPNYYVNSDRNKKHNIRNFSEHIRLFTLNDTGKDMYGVVAQEVAPMFREGEEGHMTVNYSSVLAYYVGILENKNKELEGKVSNLESEIEWLKSKVN